MFDLKIIVELNQQKKTGTNTAIFVALKPCGNSFEPLRFFLPHTNAARKMEWHVTLAAWRCGGNP